MEGALTDGIRQLRELVGHRDLGIAVTTALLYAHKNSNLVEREEVARLNSVLKTEEAGAGETAFYVAGLVHLCVGDTDAARRYAEKAANVGSGASVEVATLRAWVDAMSSRPATVEKALTAFEGILASSAGQNCVDAYLGKAKCLLTVGDADGALAVLNLVTVHFDFFFPGHTEKARVYMALSNWEEAFEICRSVLRGNPFDIDALFIASLCDLAYAGQYDDAVATISDLASALEKREPRNAELFLRISRPLARLSGRVPDILRLTLSLTELASKLQSSPEALIELAYQYTLADDLEAAVESYQAAMALDETNIAALVGVTLCQLLEGDYDSAVDSLVFFTDLDLSPEHAPFALYTRALYAWRHGGDAYEAVRLLDEAVAIHLDAASGKLMGPDLFVALNPDFLLLVADEYLQHCGSEPKDEAEPINPVLEKAIRVLEACVRAVKGSHQAMLALAGAKYVAGDFKSAENLIQEVIAQNPHVAEGHILLARIYLSQGQYRLAHQANEQALSRDFAVQNNPVYLLVKAKIAEREGDLDEAVRTLTAAMRLPGVKKLSKKAAPVPVHDRVSVFIQLSLTLAAAGQQHEATKFMQDAINEFGEGGQAVRVTVASAELALSRGDVEGAIRTLKRVSPDQPFYLKARTALARIYLDHKHDVRMYANTFKELAETNPSVQTYLILGDSYMNIQEPEKAIAVYESALKLNPKDTALAIKIGEALVKTHDYDRAIEYYVSAAKGNPSQGALRLSLAKLYTRLRRYEEAQSVIETSLALGGEADTAGMLVETQLLVLLSAVRSGQDDLVDAIQSLERARERQAAVLARIRGEQPDLVREQTQQMALICYKLGSLHSSLRSHDEAIAFYNESLNFDPNSEDCILALAELYLSREELEQCEKQCLALLRLNAAHKEASVMLADIMFRKQAYETAVFYFRQLLEQQPDHYDAFVRLLELLRRSGRLEESEYFFELAEKNHAGRVGEDAGLSYCRGLHALYTNNMAEAMDQFNLARGHHEWKERALVHMIRICLNPDSDVAGETFADTRDAGELEVSRANAFALLGELTTQPPPLKHRVLRHWATMTDKKADIEAALGGFQEILSVDSDYVPALLGAATAHMRLKQSQKARTYLKKIRLIPYNSDDGDDFGAAYLLFADIHINMNKYDYALELLKLCLNYNRSCAKAWEYMGYIMEKEQSYKNAADYYEKAWTFANKANPRIGFRLAFNYLKDHKYIAAIDVCQTVLADTPDYPRIEKEILNKARGSLRQ